MNYYHVDVFSAKPMSGNGLTVVFPQESLSATQMLAITNEFKQFETIFIFPSDRDGVYPARIFTTGEELLFAGHPILGAGAVMHELLSPDINHMEVAFQLGERRIQVQSDKKDMSYQVTMNQGAAKFIRDIEKTHYAQIAAALHISTHDIDKEYPIEVVSTGLPYLLIPLRSNLCNSKITRKDFESFLSAFEAKFVYVFDTNTLECRTWDNAGTVEDVATGSAAGPLCAYLVRNKMKKPNEKIELHQGSFVNRPSVITGWVSQNEKDETIYITGEVSFFASGQIKIML
jgi:PhzF family phenazine biosynthesis protein